MFKLYKLIMYTVNMSFTIRKFLVCLHIYSYIEAVVASFTTKHNWSLLGLLAKIKV